MSATRLSVESGSALLRASVRGSLVALIPLLMACGGGGGGGGSGGADKHAQLLAVTFPDPNDVNAEPTDTPPAEAPLVQQVVLTFTGRPDPNLISVSTIQIRDAANLPVPGTFDVSGNEVI